ncbi:GTP-binding nuclear protein Ran-related protein [Penicillium capsulatum]|uniref:GTP-binding nuclear protein Ran-related protein n=1 Tax=Penicillium capsulatum TaxID=69766 RepID=A0A9W9ICG8_9EURO|nr:GTP-binding nuclear protein Ran-related protein [Penicillium capsulatum]KAJ6135136.1 GTP-binding nuclear protein Ran-related protein [Penicillium capsulatum]
MDVFLTRLTQQAMNYAIRSGIAITAGYAMRQSARLLKNVDGEDRDELLSLQQRLESKIQVISPSIDMIELIAARGNTSLESAVALTKSLRWDIQALGQRLAKAAASEESLRKGSRSSRDRPCNEAEIKSIIKDIKKLLTRIEDAVPLMNLAITTSGVKLSTNLPSTVSPSRLLQASTFLTAGDTQYSMSQAPAMQIGPTFTVSLYMLFASHLRPRDEESVRQATWQEVMHKARLRLRRVPLSLYCPDDQPNSAQSSGSRGADEYAYQVLIVEDFDDGRVHTLQKYEPTPEPYEGVATAGIRDILPVHQISKIFYADTGRILNINTDGETNNPVLLLKRDYDALPPRRMMEDEEFETESSSILSTEAPPDEDQAQLDAQLHGASGLADPTLSSLHESSIPHHWQMPRGLDLEWLAFEVYDDEDESSDTESESERPQTTTAESALDPSMMAKLSLRDNDPSSPSPLPSRSGSPSQPNVTATTVSNPLFENIRTSLSLLETLLRLTSLQQFQQQSHLSISDELLNFFLEESSTTGAGGDEKHRQRLRNDARRRVGWDPYDESPVKRRGEDYQYGVDSSTPSSRPDSEEYSGGTSQSFQIRSRENTPETPPRSHGRPGYRSDHRGPSGLRDMASAYSDDGESTDNSPLAKYGSRSHKR